MTHTHRSAVSVPRATTLVVDDDPQVREALRGLLEHEGLTVLEAGDGSTALEIVQRGGIDLLLLDLELPRLHGLEVLKVLSTQGPPVPTIIVSGRGSIRTAITTTKLGALDFLEKPVNGPQAISVVRGVLGQVVDASSADEAKVSLADTCGIVGSSDVIGRLLSQLARAAKSDAKVLLTGESGSGKELAARAIHANGSRRGRPFVAVNCAAIPETLIEAELFGHERGAFTGAVSRRQGRFELAHRGTLFLDEVVEMSLMTQATVLRVLEDRVIQRVGAEREIAVDCRLIAATNRSLESAMEQGDFREDLYFRLNVIQIHVPPLRERREDIPELADSFLRAIALSERLAPRTLAPAARAALMAHDWRGNVRELRNVAERMMVLGDDGPIGVQEVHQALTLSSDEALSPRASLHEARAEFERQYIGRALVANSGRIQETADELGVNRSHLWRKMKRLGIAAPTPAPE